VSQEHRRAISGSVVLVDGGAVSWSLKKQGLITLSTPKAKYVNTHHKRDHLVSLSSQQNLLSFGISNHTLLR